MSCWLVKLTRICSSVIKLRVKKFLFCCNLRIGLIVISFHTLLIGSCLLLPYLTQPGDFVLDLVFLPDDVTLVSGLFGTPMVVLGMCLLMAAFKPKPGLLDAYIINMQALQCMFPIAIAFLHLRTYINTENLLQNSGRDTQFAFRYTLYYFLTFSVVTYCLFLYYIVVVLSFKDQYLKKLKELRVNTLSL